MWPILLYVTFAGATKESWSNPTRVSSGDLAAITKAPTPPQPPLDHLNAIDRACAASWLAWSDTYSSIAAVYTNPNRTGFSRTPAPTTRYTESRIINVPLVSTSSWRECDGIPRLAYNTTAFSTSTETYYLDRFLTEPPDYFDVHPFPKCGLEGEACYDAWLHVANLTGSIGNRNTDFGALLGMDKIRESHYDGRDFFGCKPPEDLCTKAFGGCSFGAARVFMIFFPPKVESRDLCARDGFGSYVLADDTLAPGEPMPTAVLETLPFETADLSGTQLEAARKAMTGPFTFTSGTVYVAYAGMYASQKCMHTSDHQYHYGVTPVPLAQISTMYYPRDGWNDTWLHYAQSMAAGKINDDTFGQATLTAALDLVDLLEPMPAAKYSLHEANCRAIGGNCTAIVEGGYFPYVSVPNVFTDLDPAFAGCTQSQPLWDPPITLTPTRAARRPTAPSWAKSRPSDDIENVDSPAAPTAIQAAPGNTAASMPGPTDLAPDPAATAVTTVRRTGQIEESSEQELPEWGGPAIAMDATKVKATPVAANPGVIAIGPNLFVAGGPGYLSNGQKISLGALGLVVGTRTLSVEYASKNGGDKSASASAHTGGAMSGSALDAADVRPAQNARGPALPSAAKASMESMAGDDNSVGTTSTLQSSASGIVRVAATTSSKSGAVRHMKAPRWFDIFRALSDWV